MAAIQTNFAQLAEYDEQLLRLGLLAERYFPEDPNTSLLKLRQLTELLAQHVATNVGAYVSTEEAQYELIRRLQDQGILPREIAQLFSEVRRAGNAASHALAGDHRTALAALKITWQIGVWFHRTFKDPSFKSGAFIPPRAPRDESDDLRAELARLTTELAEHRAAHHEVAQHLESTEAMLREAKDEQSFWEQMAVEAENARAALATRLAAQQVLTVTQSKETVAAFVAAANTAATAVHLDEAETRNLIDQQLRAMPLADIAAWFTRNPDLGEILDRKEEGPAALMFVSEHQDQLLSIERGYGEAKRPDDYLNEFTAFINSHCNDIPALLTVLTRPRELTRKQLRELALELDRAGYSETNLATAWREKTNQDIAARIVGYIRQAAIGDPLLPYEQRVDNALRKMLASRTWTTPQRQWLQKIAAQTKANLIVDRTAFDDPDLVFKREGGGFARLDRIFGGELARVLDTFNDALWQRPAA